jgi:hypothetical protein
MANDRRALYHHAESGWERVLIQQWPARNRICGGIWNGEN